MSAGVREKIRKFTRYFYKVPWCVPQWGWEETRSTLCAFLAGRVVSGPHVANFEEQVRTFLGMKYAVTVNHARFGIELALRAIGVTGEDEVVVPSYLCETVLDAVILAGAKPVFADAGADLQVSAEEIRRVLTPRTRCVIVAHLFGNTAPVDEIEELLRDRKIVLIDDAAQSLGAVRKGRRAGTFGDAGIVSIGAGKPLTGPAGGVLVTNDVELYRRAAAISLPSESSANVLRRIATFWAWRRHRHWTLPLFRIAERVLPPAHPLPESACRMSNLDAAIGIAQLRKLSANAADRRRNGLALCDWLRIRPADQIADFDGTMARLVILLPEKGPVPDEFIEALADSGVEAQIGYRPLHCAMPGPGCIHADAVWQRVLWVPVETMPPSLPRFPLDLSRS